MATLTTKCECGAEYCSAHKLSEYAILKEKLAVSEKALEFYASQERETERLHQELIKKSNTAIELQFYSNVPCIARQALAVIKGEIKNY